MGLWMSSQSKTLLVRSAISRRVVCSWCRRRRRSITSRQCSARGSPVFTHSMHALTSPVHSLCDPAPTPPTHPPTCLPACHPSHLAHPWQWRHQLRVWHEIFLSSSLLLLHRHQKRCICWNRLTWPAIKTTSHSTFHLLRSYYRSKIRSLSWPAFMTIYKILNDM